MKDDFLVPLGILLALLFFTTKANAAGGNPGGTNAGSGTSPSPGMPSSSTGVTAPGTSTGGNVVCPAGQNQYSIYHALSDTFETACDPNMQPGAVVIQNN